MEMFKEAMKAASSKGGNSGNCNNNRNRGNKNGDKALHAPCKHCSFKHTKADENCWNLEANKAKQPANWVLKTKNDS